MGSALAPKCQLCPSRDGLGPAPRKACEKLLTPRVTRDFAQQAARGRGGARVRTDGRTDVGTLSSRKAVSQQERPCSSSAHSSRSPFASCVTLFG